MRQFRPLMTAATLIVLGAGPLAAQGAPGDMPPANSPAHPAMMMHGKHHGAMARLTVGGQGLSSAQPDLATISLGVSSRAATAAEAMTQNAEAQNKVIEALKAEGIEARDIQTSGLNLSPMLDYSKDGEAPRVTGYAAQNNVTVRVRDIAGRLGEPEWRVVFYFTVIANGLGGVWLAVAQGFRPLDMENIPLLIGLGAVLLMLGLGRIFGATGVLSGAIFAESREEMSWRLALIAGMILAPVLIFAITGAMPALTVPVSPAMIAVGGVIVGLGASLGSGCTSGHGVCGLSRLSVRSLVAVPTFMATAAITVFLVRHVFGG